MPASGWVRSSDQRGALGDLDRAEHFPSVLVQHWVGVLVHNDVHRPAVDGEYGVAVAVDDIGRPSLPAWAAGPAGLRIPASPRVSADVDRGRAGWVPAGAYPTTMAAAVALAVASSCASGSVAPPSVASISRWRTASAGILQRASQPSTKQLSRHRPVSASRTCSLVTSASASQARQVGPLQRQGWPADLAVGHRGVVGVAMLSTNAWRSRSRRAPNDSSTARAAPGQSGAALQPGGLARSRGG